MLISIIFYIQTVKTIYSGDLDCALMADKITCNQSGYCYWRIFNNKERCVGLQCHLVNEIQACRSGWLTPRCSVVSYIPPQYVESCFSILLGDKNYYYRFQSDLTNEQIYETTNLLGQLINSEIDTYSMYKLYNLDIISRKNDELQSILDLYIKHEKYLTSKNCHPYYIERIIYETLQNIRDDQQITLQIRQLTMDKILQLLDIYYERLTTFSKVYYTVYNFIYFNHIHLQYFQLPFQQIALFTWIEYPSNGFFQVTVLYLEIFGLQSPASPVFIIRINNQQLVQYKLKWTMTTSNSLKLVQIDLITLEKYDTFIKPLCVSGYCEVELQGAGNYVFIQTAVSDNCSAINNREVCLQALCVYDYDIHICQNN